MRFNLRDPSKRGPQNAARVDISSDYEIRYWTTTLSVTKARRIEVVTKVAHLSSQYVRNWRRFEGKPSRQKGRRPTFWRLIAGVVEAIAMDKTLRSESDLLQMINAELAELDACKGMQCTGITALHDASTHSNWTADIMSGSGTPISNDCRRLFIGIKATLQRQFDLATDV